ncbi:MAG: dTMP kinase [Candidatus Marinimicrobia bacterium]|nr:dTMP kinase [Candidatus Neomarinimicrobiota bacterium]MCH8068885.1 dTMP kinase [Candidatus Neomarinimicrobiota bacterium]
MKMKGIFITFEGIDGCGKTTQAELLEIQLKQERRNIVLVREPGGTVISEQIRSIILDKNHNEMDPITETILLAASRAQLTEEIIIPNVESGNIVISDRYTDSTLAYQGFGRGLDITWLKNINKFATKDTDPDITILVDIPVEVAISRMEGKSFDRMEIEGNEFLKRVRKGYLHLAQDYSDRFIVVDGMKSIHEIQTQIWKSISKVITSNWIID